MQSQITAIGTANPKYYRTQEETAELMSAVLELTPRRKAVVESIYKSSGIERRYSVISDYCKTPSEFEFFPSNLNEPFPSTAKRMNLYKDSALGLALAAINDCLDGLKSFNKNDITHVITVSCTGMYAPGLDIEIVQELNLNPSTNRTAINFMGCYGAFNGLKVADAFCKANPNSNVLVVCVEICTIHFKNELSMKNVISDAIFADGAAAVLVQGNARNQKSFSLHSFYCDLVPQTSQEMAWTIADQGFDIILSSYVPEAIKSGILNFSQKLLKETNISFNEIDYYGIHPGGIKILQACEEALSITPEDNRFSYEILRNFGNMSSATVLFVLKSIWGQLTQKDHNKNVFSCAFGPGLTLESMLLKIQNN